MDKDFPCKVCGHFAERHYVNIATNAGVCTGCDTYEPGRVYEQFHGFVGDNLKYLELLNKRKELLSE